MVDKEFRLNDVLFELVIGELGLAGCIPMAYESHGDKGREYEYFHFGLSVTNLGAVKFSFAFCGRSPMHAVVQSLVQLLSLGIQAAPQGLETAGLQYRVHWSAAIEVEVSISIVSMYFISMPFVRVALCYLCTAFGVPCTAYGRARGTSGLVSSWCIRFAHCV